MVSIGEWFYAPLTDYYGNPRKVDERIDLGATESPYAKKAFFEIDDVDSTGTDGELCEGTAQVTFDGGVPPFTFYLDDVEVEGLTFEDLCEGSYAVRIVDADGSELNALSPFQGL